MKWSGLLESALVEKVPTCHLPVGLFGLFPVAFSGFQFLFSFFCLPAGINRPLASDALVYLSFFLFLLDKLGTFWPFGHFFIIRRPLACCALPVCSGQLVARLIFTSAEKTAIKSGRKKSVKMPESVHLVETASMEKNHQADYNRLSENSG